MSKIPGVKMKGDWAEDVLDVDYSRLGRAQALPNTNLPGCWVSFPQPNLQFLP